MRVGFFVGWDETINREIFNDTEVVSVMYSSMLSLWNHREDFDMFIVRLDQPGAMIGLPSLKNYCLDNNKMLSVDIEPYSSLVVNANDNKNPSICTIVIISKDKRKLGEDNIVEDDDPTNELIPPYHSTIISVRSSKYDSLKQSALINSKITTYKDIPVVYQHETLQSAYHDIVYVRK